MNLSHFKWTWVISSLENSDSSYDSLQLCSLTDNLISAYQSDTLSIHKSVHCHLLMLSSLCLVYSHMSKAPLTWTLRDLTIPSWGISTQMSSNWISSTGMPPRSFLPIQNITPNSMRITYINLKDFIIISCLCKFIMVHFSSSWQWLMHDDAQCKAIVI